jgi:hypothetical protein
MWEESRETKLFEKSKGPGWGGSLLSSSPFILERPGYVVSLSMVPERATRRSKKKGFFEVFLAKLAVLPFRCDRGDCRFFRRTAKLKSHTGSSISASLFSTLQIPPGTLAVALPK